MGNLEMPSARKFGWKLKPVSSSQFEICERDNGQFCVVLNHALLRGVRAEMIHWWFMNFPNLRIWLRDVAGYEDQEVPGYLLWHPSDHHSALLSGDLGTDNTAKPGCTIQIREAMQYDTYGWKYPVDTKLKVFYVGEDGWAMGKVLPLVGPVMMLRIHFKDVFDGTKHLGVHYHYEVVIGASGKGLIARQINRRVTSKFDTEFFSAWQKHNVIEVGTFENFLPALFSQKDNLSSLAYAPDMDPMKNHSEVQTSFSQEIFDRRVNGYRQTNYPNSFQNYSKASFL